MHGSLPECEVCISNLARALVVADVEGHTAKKLQEKSGKGTLEVFGNEIFGLIKKKTENDSVPGSSFASELKRKVMQVIPREDPSS